MDPYAGATPRDDVASPCVGICAIGADGLCIGCFRSVAELSAWTSASPAEQRAILARCRERQARALRR